MGPGDRLDMEVGERQVASAMVCRSQFRWSHKS